MITKDRELQISKFLSYVLRHQPQTIGLTLAANGWAPVEALLSNSSLPINFEELKYVVEHNDKQRFAFNEDLTLIRANQGHSVKIAMNFQEIIPPTVLYHGTAQHFLPSILQKGLLKGKRHHVHLSKDIQTASKVGQRHGKLLILKVDTEKMVAAGHQFYLTDNQVYLVKHVPPNYLSKLNSD
jgi:putative RNA 2'-phosphotransferase